MLLLSLLLPAIGDVMAVQLVLLKRMLVIPDQRMALDQGRTQPPMQWLSTCPCLRLGLICPAALIAL